MKQKSSLTPRGWGPPVSLTVFSFPARLQWGDPESSEVPTQLLAHSPPSGTRDNKSKKTHGSRWRQFNEWRKEKKIPSNSKAITHRQNDAQRVSEQWILWKTNPLSFNPEHDIIWLGRSQVSLGQLSWLRPLPASCCSPASLLGAEWETEEALTLCSTVEQKLNHWSAINTDSVTNPNHSSIWAVMKTLTPSQAGPVQYYFQHGVLGHWTWLTAA